MASITAKFDYVNETGMAMTITLIEDCGSETVIGIKSMPNSRRAWTYTVEDRENNYWRLRTDDFLFNDRDTAQTSFDPENIFHAAYIVQMVQENGHGWSKTGQLISAPEGWVNELNCGVRASDEHYQSPLDVQIAAAKIIEQRRA